MHAHHASKTRYGCGSAVATRGRLMPATSSAQPQVKSSIIIQCMWLTHACPAFLEDLNFAGL